MKIFDVIYKLLNSLYLMLFSNDTYNDFDDYEININIKIDFEEFKKYKTDKVLYVLNNMSSQVYSALYSRYNDVSDRYFQITLNNHDGYFDISHCKMIDFDNVLNDDLIRYVYIRVNLDGNKYIDHVNCIVIDKLKKYILYFEPTVHIRYDIDKIKSLLSNFADLDGYNSITPYDIGYNSLNGLQQFDHYCQTYILYIFCLILENRNIEPINFSKMFNNVINKQRMEYFWYYIYNVMICNGFNIDNLDITHKIDDNAKIDIISEDDYLIIN